jgi:hypothetical protein
MNSAAANCARQLKLILKGPFISPGGGTLFSFGFIQAPNPAPRRVRALLQKELTKGYCIS